MLSLSSCVCWSSVCLLWRNVCLGLFPLFDYVCFSGIESYELLILEVTPLSVVSFAVQKLLNISRSHLLIFVFISIILRERLKKYIAVIYVRESSAYVFL